MGTGCPTCAYGYEYEWTGYGGYDAYGLIGLIGLMEYVGGGAACPYVQE